MGARKSKGGGLGHQLLAGEKVKDKQETRKRLKEIERAVHEERKREREQRSNQHLSKEKERSTEEGGERVSD